jgi:hypothetical protein
MQKRFKERKGISPKKRKKEREKIVSLATTRSDRLCLLVQIDDKMKFLRHTKVNGKRTVNSLRRKK